MVGMGVKHLIASEKEAQSEYSTADKAAKKKKDKPASKTFRHIRSEEVEHEGMLKRLGER
jgi:rubrerythrin